MAFKSVLLNIATNVFSNSAAYRATPIALSTSQKTTVLHQPISKHLELFQNENSPNNHDLKGGLNSNIDNDISTKPLVVLLGWLMAKPHHLKKYSDVYIDRGYNVLTVSMTPWQFFWPITGAQLVADELLNFLKMAPTTQPLILHGFSIGAYLWGECLVKMNADLPKYSNIINRIKGQIWDSAPDISELHKGFPMALAPNNAILRRAAERYFAYHMKKFYDVATQHYLRSSQLFHTTPVKAPSLIFVCKNDPIASYTSNKKVQEYWDSVGMKTYLKCWEKSKHVSHIILHREEYIATLDDFLSSLDVKQDASKQREKIAAKL